MQDVAFAEFEKEPAGHSTHNATDVRPAGAETLHMCPTPHETPLHRVAGVTVASVVWVDMNNKLRRIAKQRRDVWWEVWERKNNSDMIGL